MIPRRAMVLAAGLGKRMRPITESIPKPLVPICGKTLIDWGLDALEEAGVAEAVVNAHYLADRLEAHLAHRRTPRVTISDEREKLLDSAGGIVKALPELGDEPFVLLNADTFWLDRRDSNLLRLFDTWDDKGMDILLLLADPAHATGHEGNGTDFTMDGQGRLARAGNRPDGLIYAGAGLLHPRIFANARPEPHSLNLYFDRAIAASRLHGIVLDGQWITVGTPDAIAPAEATVRSVAEARGG